jgi:hypothetical protein
MRTEQSTNAETNKANTLNANVPGRTGLKNASAQNSAGNSPNQDNMPQTKQTSLYEVCPIPQSPCQNVDKSFEDYELSFRLPTKLSKTGNYKSHILWGILLKQDVVGKCGDGAGSVIQPLEDERIKLQEQYAHNKVFAYHGCPDLSAVTYSYFMVDNVDSKEYPQSLGNPFLAIYGGKTKAEAEALSDKLKSKYPDLWVRKMRVEYDNSLVNQ